MPIIQMGEQPHQQSSAMNRLDMHMTFLGVTSIGLALPITSIAAFAILILGLLFTLRPRSLISLQIEFDRWRRRSILPRLGFDAPLSFVPWSAPAGVALESPEAIYAYWRSDAFWFPKWRRVWFLAVGLFLIACAIFMLGVVVSEMA